MKERPILFSAPMVRAILSGAKTQTRRIMKPQPYSNGRWSREAQDIVCHNDYLPPSALLLDVGRGKNRYTCSDVEDDLPTSCPYGVPGDRLWVRETLRRRDGGRDPDVWQYEADQRDVQLPRDHPDVPAMISWAHHKERPHCPSIHMPRWASRITLEVTDVRVERLESISGEDARAEGIAVPRCSCEVCMRSSAMCPADASEHVMAFAQLWDAINGKRAPWASNPWVWCVSFRRVQP